MGAAAATQVPMPLVPASASLHTAPICRPRGAAPRSNSGELTMCRITPSVLVSTTAESGSPSCW